MMNVSNKRKSGWFWLGIVLLCICALFWMVLIIGIAADPEDALDAIFGAIIITIVPIGIGIYSIKRGRKLQMSEKEKFKCRTCGFLNKGDSRFCESCGTILNPIGEGEIERKACPKCGHEVLQGSEYCEECGYKITEKREDKKGGFWEPEKAGIKKGVLGGIIMMIVAVIWFFVGLHFDWVFFYPPILFVIGLYAFIKGALAGNISGRKE